MKLPTTFQLKTGKCTFIVSIYHFLLLPRSPYTTLPSAQIKLQRNLKPCCDLSSCSFLKQKLRKIVICFLQKESIQNHPLRACCSASNRRPWPQKASQDLRWRRSSVVGFGGLSVNWPNLNLIGVSRISMWELSTVETDPFVFGLCAKELFPCSSLLSPVTMLHLSKYADIGCRARPLVIQSAPGLKPRPSLVGWRPRPVFHPFSTCETAPNRPVALRPSSPVSWVKP